MKGKHLGYIKFKAHSVVFFLGFENQVLGLMPGMVVICTPSEDIMSNIVINLMHALLLPYRSGTPDSQWFVNLLYRVYHIL